MRLFQKYAFDFDASKTQYIYFDSIVKQVLSEAYDGFAISFWYQGNVDGNSGNFISWTYCAEVYRIRQNSNGILYSYLTHLIGDAYVTALSVNSINDGNWHHVVAVWDGGQRRYTFYIDGMLDNTCSVSFNIIDIGVAYGITLGAADRYGREPLSGKMGDIRIYNRPLTEEEIQYLYKGGHIVDGLVFWLYPDEESVTLDSDGQTVLSITEKVNGYVGTAYNGVKLVDGKDIDIAKSLGKKFLIVRKV